MAISSIELLKAFISLYAGEIDTNKIKWLVIVHLTFVISGVLFAVMERILHPPQAHSSVAAGESPNHD